MIRHRRGSRGTALVEFALVMPIFALLLFAIIDMSRFVYSNNALSELAREAARAGSVAVRPECSGTDRVACIRSIAAARVTAVDIQLTDVNVVCQRPAANGSLPGDGATDNCGGSWRANDIITVRITRQFEILTPVFAQIVGPADMVGEARVTVKS